MIVSLVLKTTDANRHPESAASYESGRTSEQKGGDESLFPRGRSYGRLRMRVKDQSNDDDILDRLLGSVLVQLHHCNVCIISPDIRARFDAVERVSIQYVASGRGCIQIGNNSSIEIEAGTIVITPMRTMQFWAGSEACQDASGGTLCSSVVGISCPWAATETKGLSLVRMEISVSTNGVDGFFDQLRLPIIEKLSENGAANRALELLLPELSNPGVGSKAVTEGLIRGLLVLVLRCHFQNESAAPFAMLGDPRLARAMINVIEHPDQPHTLESLAIAAGMSRSAFSDRFKEVFGHTPNDFVQECRLKHAAYLLKTTTLPIKTVALSVGYSSRSYFSRAFRDAHGLDPTAFRRANCVGENI